MCATHLLGSSFLSATQNDSAHAPFHRSAWPLACPFPPSLLPPADAYAKGSYGCPTISVGCRPTNSTLHVLHAKWKSAQAYASRLHKVPRPLLHMNVADSPHVSCNRTVNCVHSDAQLAGLGWHPSADRGATGNTTWQGRTAARAKHPLAHRRGAPGSSQAEVQHSL
jgi:hypothetical protein